MNAFLNSLNLINAKVMIFRSTYSYSSGAAWSCEITGEIEGTTLTVKTEGQTADDVVAKAEELWAKRTRHIPELNPMLTYSGTVTENGDFVSDDA